MGLFYLMPVSEEESDHVKIKSADQELHLMSYGPPYIFWIYLLLILGVIFIMYLLIQKPLEALIATGDPLNILIGQAAFVVCVTIPLGLLSFFFYTKRMIKQKTRLVIMHELFWIPLFKKVITMKSAGSLSIKHFMDSPNMARMKKNEDLDPLLDPYMNKGYFELFAENDLGQLTLVDRSSRKADLEKLKILLEKY